MNSALGEGRPEADERRERAQAQADEDQHDVLSGEVEPDPYLRLSDRSKDGELSLPSEGVPDQEYADRTGPEQEAQQPEGQEDAHVGGLDTGVLSESVFCGLYICAQVAEGALQGGADAIPAASWRLNQQHSRLGAVGIQLGEVCVRGPQRALKEGPGHHAHDLKRHGLSGLRGAHVLVADAQAKAPSQGRLVSDDRNRP